ncbi:MAG: hypothetical protein KIT09_15665 [Bryobacteraceae bacterium]|nr:hypothetical protein [Bryobacteraceae bacterium]
MPIPGKRALFWLGLALAGQAAALRLIDAGIRLHYQHYRPLEILLKEHPLALGIVAAQAIAVLAGLRGIRRPLSRWLRSRLRIWQLAAIGVAFFLTSATVSENVRFYVYELFFAAVIQAVNLANIVLFAWRLPVDSPAGRLDRWLGGDSEGGGGIDRFAVGAAIWVTVVAALLNHFSYQRHPHVPDEVVYLYHARYLAEGKLTLPLPPVPKAFDVDLMNYEETRWYCPVPPGWPAALAVGSFFGVPWLVNPVLGGINMLLAYVLMQGLYHRRAARLALLLLCSSPWQVFLAMSFMTHTLTLTLALLSALGVMLARKHGRAWWGLVAGLATGGVGLVRPLEGFTWAVLLGLWAIGFGGRRLKPAALAAFVLGGAVIAGLTLYYNQLLTGDPKVFPIMAYTDKYYGKNSNALGFGPDRGFGWGIDPYPGHSPRDAVINANLNTYSINIELFGWSTGSLLPAALFLFAGRPRGPDWLMLAAIAAIFGVHFFYYFSGGPDFGARYWYLMLIPLVALSVRGVELLTGMIEASAPGNGVRALAAVAALCALSVINYFPWRAIDKYYHYENMRPDIRELAKQYQFGRSLVLVRGNRHPDYASAAIYNPLDLEADAPLYAWDRGPEVRAEAARAYRDRPVWLVDGPTVTGNGFRVVAGPLAASEVAAAAGAVP